VTANGKHSGPAVATGTLPQGRIAYAGSKPAPWRTMEPDACPPGSVCAQEAIERVKWRLENERPSRVLVINRPAPWQGGGE
jgi:hypothetical protein